MSVKGIIMFIGMNNIRLERNILIILDFENGFLPTYLPQCCIPFKSCWKSFQNSMCASENGNSYLFSLDFYPVFKIPSSKYSSGIFRFKEISLLKTFGFHQSENFAKGSKNFCQNAFPVKLFHPLSTEIFIVDKFNKAENSSFCILQSFSLHFSWLPSLFPLCRTVVTR